MVLLLSGGVEVQVPFLASVDILGVGEDDFPEAIEVWGGRVVTSLPLDSVESPDSPPGLL